MSDDAPSRDQTTTEPGPPGSPTDHRLADLASRLRAHGRLRSIEPGADGSVDAAGARSVEAIGHDSRLVTPGSVFVAIPGARHDGHGFVAAAAAHGAAAAIVERAIPDLGIPQLVVTAARPSLADAAAWWYGDPSRSLSVIGITGTDGKTTTAHLAVAALEAAGRRVGMIGTIATRIGGVTDDHAEHATTPEAPALQSALRAMVDAGDDTAIIETTSHGLALDRVASIDYDVAVLTNLTHEHLDLHGTWEAYRDAKLSLFSRLPGPDGVAVINIDDPSAATFVAAARSIGARIVTFGTSETADVRATGIAAGPDGLIADVRDPTSTGRLDLHLAGHFNVHNALAVIGIGVALDLDTDVIRRGLGTVRRIPGRMESIVAGQPFDVIVDFAHSPAALQTVLDGLAPVVAERGAGLIVVFGSAGERDTAKRSVMGRIAGERCRLVVITDEDPRGEDRAAILDEIARGAEQAGRRRGDDLWLIPDREGAIREALRAARDGDVVVLAGKGHERSIIGAQGERPWDERAVAASALAEMGFTPD
jgi:UDP-N-acetylmuramoyl-L-alanyl-D-glutamate--2,6-diaminopimelate ligase